MPVKCLGSNCKQWPFDIHKHVGVRTKDRQLSARAEERTGGRNGQGQEVEEARGNQVCHLLKVKRRAVGLNLAPLFFDPQGILNLKHGAEGEALVGEASAAASGAEVAAGRAERG